MIQLSEEIKLKPVYVTKISDDECEFWAKPSCNQCWGKGFIIDAEPNQFQSKRICRCVENKRRKFREKI